MAVEDRGASVDEARKGEVSEAAAVAAVEMAADAEAAAAVAAAARFSDGGGVGGESERSPGRAEEEEMRSRDVAGSTAVQGRQGEDEITSLLPPPIDRALGEGGRSEVAHESSVVSAAVGMEGGDGGRRALEAMAGVALAPAAAEEQAAENVEQEEAEEHEERPSVAQMFASAFPDAVLLIVEMLGNVAVRAESTPMLPLFVFHARRYCRRRAILFEEHM